MMSETGQGEYYRQERAALQAAVRRLYEQPSYKETEFLPIALRLFRFQARYNAVYARFLEALGVEAQGVERLEDIPFLPIICFKHHRIQSGDWEAELIFESSGTTRGAGLPSKHYVAQADWYVQCSLRGFGLHYGDPSRWLLLALLPSYMERGASSLVYMVERLTERAAPGSGFYLYDLPALIEAVEAGLAKGLKVMIWGVSYALLDLAEQYPQTDWGRRGVTVLETGGMKGRRRELLKSELHRQLRQGLGLTEVHSEYGMTELLSQAYSSGGGVFLPTPSLLPLVRDPYDPLAYIPQGKTGALNLIDLANIDTCAFIATDDLGRLLPGGGFEVLGRLDAAELRGCNLMMSDE